MVGWFVGGVPGCASRVGHGVVEIPPIEALARALLRALADQRVHRGSNVGRAVDAVDLDVVPPVKALPRLRASEPDWAVKRSRLVQSCRDAYRVAVDVVVTSVASRL